MPHQPQHYAVAKPSEDEEALPKVQLVQKNNDMVLYDDDDFDGDTDLIDDETLNSQLDIELEGITSLNHALGAEQGQRGHCLVRCFCGTRNSRVISVWFFTFLIFGIIEIIGALKVCSDSNTCFCGLSIVQHQIMSILSHIMILI